MGPCYFIFVFLLCFVMMGAVGVTTKPPATTKPPTTVVPGPGTGNKDAIKALPGLRFNYKAKQYSGYLTSGGAAKLFYWYLESQDSPAKNPIIVWLSAYPGCSTLPDLLTEIGPFRPNPDPNTLHENVFAWNKAANLLLIDSPASVGFSTNVQGTTTDDQVINANFQALRDFFYTKFPSLQSNDLYIGGEGYAGVFALTLAKKVLDNAPKQFPNMLKGVIIGNGALSQKYQFNGMINMAYFHGLMGTDTWDQLRANCICIDEPSEQCGFYGAYNATSTTECKKSLNSILQEFSSNMSLDITNIHQDCYSGEDGGRPKRSLRANIVILDAPAYFPPSSIKKPDPAIVARTAPKSANDVPHMINYDSTDSSLGFSCWADPVKYLSNKAVMQALHVDSSVKTFVSCQNIVYKQNYSYLEMDKVMTAILKKGTVRMLIYSGDLDLEYNSLGQEWFIDRHLAMNPDLKLKIVQNREPWKYRGQTAGFIKRYTNLESVVIKGAGRRAGMDRGGPVLQMLVNFLKHSNSYSNPSNINVSPNGAIGVFAKGNCFTISWAGFIVVFIGYFLVNP